MNDVPTYIELKRTMHRPVRIDTILAERMKRLMRKRQRQIKRQRKQVSDER